MTNGHMTTEEREAYARQTVIEFTQQFWDDRTRQLGQMLPFAEMAHLLMDANRHVPFLDEWLTQGMEPQEWLLMARAGLGLVKLPDDPEDANYITGEVYEICQGLVEWLFSIPGMATYEIPDIWAEHPLGQLWHLAMIWLAGDELITIGEAARLAGVSHQAISNQIKAGKMRAYVDPNAPARQGRRLVRKDDVTISPTSG